MAPIFSIFHDSPKTFILQQVSSETLVFTSQTLSFCDQISIKISCFLSSRFWTPFFRHFSNMMPKNTILGPPSGSSSGPNGTQNRPSGAKRRKKNYKSGATFCIPENARNISNYCFVCICVFLRFWEKKTSKSAYANDTIKIMFFNCFWPTQNTSRNIEPIGPSKSSGVQNCGRNRPSGAKKLQC